MNCAKCGQFMSCNREHICTPSGFKNHKHKEESLIKMRLAKKGKKASSETRLKLSNSHKGKNVGSNNGSWKGGRRFKNGYKEILCRDHPYHDNKGYVKEHRLVMEAHIGRYLLPSEIVHHINGDRLDNKIENLMLLSQSEHITRHNKKVDGGMNG
ncbi:MAG: HNH endonuclease signature motif containing protein [Candidatus Nanoarchaeia archaeon]|jgi:hypothetical protein